MEDNGVPKDIVIPKETYDNILYRLANPTHIFFPSEKQVGGDHYKDMPIQPSEYITKNGLGWYEGNAIKYITRYKTKGGKQDIEKAIHYLELLLEALNE